MHVGPHRGKKKEVGLLKLRVVDVCELPVVGAGNQTLSLGRTASS